MAVTERETIFDFLELYREFSCLWDTSSNLYCNRDARHKALETLTEKFKELESDTTIATVKKKIHNMRTAYKRESRKVQQSKTSGVSPNDIYVSSLWYFEYLTFLDEKDYLNRSGTDTLSGFDDEVFEIQNNNSETQKNKKRATSLQKTQQKLLATAENLLKTEDTAPEAYGRITGLQLKEMSSLQRCIAEKLISDVIFYGKLEKLNIQTTVTLNSSQIYDYEPPSPSSTSSNSFRFSPVLSRSNIESPVPFTTTPNIIRKIQPIPQPQIQQNNQHTPTPTTLKWFRFPPVLSRSNIDSQINFKAAPNIIRLTAPTQQSHIEQDDSLPEENIPSSFITTSDYNLEDYIILNN